MNDVKLNQNSNQAVRLVTASIDVEISEKAIAFADVITYQY